MHWPVKIRPWPRTLIVTDRPRGIRRTVLDEDVGRERDDHQAAIEADMLDGILRMINTDRTIFVVMVRLPLPVQQGVLDFSACSKETRANRDREEVREHECERHEYENVASGRQAATHE